MAVIEVAAAQSHRSLEDLLSGALDDPAQSRLLFSVLQVAASTMEADKIEALAKCLANGIEDVARVDEEGVIVRALADLDPVHVRVLAKLEQKRRMNPRDVHTFLAGEISARDFLTFPDVSGAVIAVLERHALVTVSKGTVESRDGRGHGPAEVWTTVECTAFGEICLGRLGVRTRRSAHEELLGTPRSST